MTQVILKSQIIYHVIQLSISLSSYLKNVLKIAIVGANVIKNFISDTEIK